MTEVAEAAQAVPAVGETTTPPAVVAEKLVADVAPEPAKTFTQAELDAIVSKRLAREMRKYERDHVTTPPAAPVVTPKPEDYATVPEYVEAAAVVKAQEMLTKQQAEQAAKAAWASYDDREEVARDKYDDFEQVARNPALPITQHMAEVVLNSDIGPEILYALGSDPKEASRISQLSPIMQAREIGRLEAKLAANPPAKKTSSAPTPISPVRPTANGGKTLDTTDPKSLPQMGTSAWIAAERDRQAAAWKAKRNR